MIKKYLLSDYSPVLASTEGDKIILELALKKVQEGIEKGTIEVNERPNSKFNNVHKLIDYVQGELYTQGIVGVFRTNIKVPDGEFYEVQVIIKSRFDNDDNKPYFLAKMLETSELTISNELSESSYDDLFEFLLVGLFKTKFLNAYQTGHYKKYVSYKGNSMKPKGTISISEYIKNSSFNKLGIPFSFTERTIDNPINRLIITAYLSLKRNFPLHVERLIDSTDAKRNLDSLINEISYVKIDIKDLIDQTNRPISHPLYSAYEELRQLCLKILRFEGLSPFNVESGETEAILYYLPDLWEEYLEFKLFKKHSFDLFSITAQPELTVVGELNIRPDYLLMQGGKPFAILDAKFKPRWSDGFDLDDYTKCIRDMNAFNTHITGVIYPSIKPSNPIIQRNSISSYNSVDQFLRIEIKVPEVGTQSFLTFSNTMDQVINSAAIQLNNELENIFSSRGE